MLYELKKKDYFLLQPMLASGFQFPEAAAVINSINSGWIVTDDPGHPISALLWVEGLSGFFLLGDETNTSFLHALDHFIDHHLTVSWFEVAGMHEGWNGVIEQYFSWRNVNKSTQLIYKWQEQAPEQGLNKDENKSTHDTHADGVTEVAKSVDFPVQVERLTADWLGSDRVKNLNFAESELCRFWGSLDQFLQHGIAYCSLRGDTIASICYSGFVADGTHTLGVKTLEPFRQQGLAYWAAKACIQELRDRGCRHLGLLVS